MPDELAPTDADPRELRKLLARLAELHQRCDRGIAWGVIREPHDYRDGTTQFTHVGYPVSMSDGTPSKVIIGRHLTPDLAELMTLSHNHLPELIALARKALDPESDPHA